ncbi:MAG: GNAT family N-acetyltransferase [Dongiaceae bacterium]
MSVSIRTLTAADADAVIAMNAAFVAYLRALGDSDSQVQHFSREQYLRDGFGPEPALIGYIAEEAGAPLGYLLYFKGYNVDIAERLFFICDLWVDPRVRRKGIARALMNRCAADCRAWGGQWLEWYVYKPNSLAFDFYRKLGAHESSGVAVMSLKSDAV